MASLEDIKKVISDIPDPEIPVISIKELGVLRNIFYQEDSLKVVITPTSVSYTHLTLPTIRSV